MYNAMALPWDIEVRSEFKAQSLTLKTQTIKKSKPSLFG